MSGVHRLCDINNARQSVTYGIAKLWEGLTLDSRRLIDEGNSAIFKIH